MATMKSLCLLGFSIFLVSCIHPVKPTCVLESDFGFTINCAFKKSGLFRVRNLGGIKAHAGFGFSVGDELGFGQSLTNLDTSRRRSVNVKEGALPNGVLTMQPSQQEKQSKKNRIKVQIPPPSSANVAITPDEANVAAMEAVLSNAVRRRGTPAIATMKPIIVETASPVQEVSRARAMSQYTLAKPLPMGLPPFRPIPPKDDSNDLRVLPISKPNRPGFTPYPIPESKGPGLAYSPIAPQGISHEQVAKMVSQMTQNSYQQSMLQQNAPVRIMNVGENLMTAQQKSPVYGQNPQQMNVPAFQAMPPSVSQLVSSGGSSDKPSGISIVSAPVFKNSIQIPLSPAMLSKTPSINSLVPNTISIRKLPIAEPQDYPSVAQFVESEVRQGSDFVNSVYPIYAQQASQKIDDYNSITGYGEDLSQNYGKPDDLSDKIAAISKATNISAEAVEAAIVLRQKQLLNQYSNILSTTSTSTTTTPRPTSPPAPVVMSVPDSPNRYTIPGIAKVMNAPKEYYPIGYEKNFDDKFVSKVDLPDTPFNCGDQKYFPGLYGDENLGCMVFHVCALTDDGLVMKSFLCPESTLFDQTILKCNWWFYVDCKNTRTLYDTNIPVSKSYQLMKALTFFSSYKKEVQENEQAHARNPENMEGIKEAIEILENQDSASDNRVYVTITSTSTTTTSKPKSVVSRIVMPRNSSSFLNHRMNREFSTESKEIYVTEKAASFENHQVEATSEIPKTVIEKTVSKNQTLDSSSKSIEALSGESTSAENVRRRRYGYMSHRRVRQDIKSTTDKSPSSTIMIVVPEATNSPKFESSTHHRTSRASGEEFEHQMDGKSNSESILPSSSSGNIVINPDVTRTEIEKTIAKLDEAIIGRSIVTNNSPVLSEKHSSTEATSPTSSKIQSSLENPSNILENA